ncbi:hypothetical protein [Saccharothrix obliqua]|uniref:hypothetical protein n=1 Tax=Saccharothrix obliqua TaxID=2861747 RepID=UPI001C5F7DFF|nr:hypothetical protein [Saccharothrix obliqua]MBW4717157.1 hypothetical protein [Saccharothrix obliqua]
MNQSTPDPEGLPPASATSPAPAPEPAGTSSGPPTPQEIAPAPAEGPSAAGSPAAGEPAAVESAAVEPAGVESAGVVDEPVAAAEEPAREEGRAAAEEPAAGVEERAVGAEAAPAEPEPPVGVPAPGSAPAGDPWAPGASEATDAMATPAYGIPVVLPVANAGWQHGENPPVAAEAPVRVVDPAAAAVGNASLFGVGYLLLGRKRLALLAGVITLALVVVHVAAVRALWLEIVIVLWWVAMIAHGWRLARGSGSGAAARRQRVIALATAVPVLLAVGFLRFDAAGIEGDSVAARDGGDCGQAVAAVDRLWFGHRVANAPLTVRGEDTVRACGRLDAASAQLRTALTGDTNALENGFTGLTRALAELPGYERVVDRALDGFLSALPTKDACDTSDLTEWLRERGTKGNALDRANEVLPRVAPAAFVQCGDDLMSASSFTEARDRYQELLDQYPNHELAPKAKDGVQKATWAIELANVRALLASPSADKPKYCDAPAPYSAAAPYGAQSPNRAWVAGTNEHTKRLPGDWLVSDVANATLVICAGAVAHGSVKETCTYLFSGTFSGEKDVSFHRIAIPVRAFEVKTGRLVAETTLEIDGESCPAVVNYTTFNRLDTGPDSDMYVTASEGDVHGAFNSLINP